LTAQGNGIVNERAEWSPDGKRVLYRSSRGNRAGLWWRAADLSDAETPLLTNEHEDYWEVVMTPDGKGIVYQIDTAGADVMYRRLSDERAAQPIANTPFNETMARVSPDGHWITYVSAESGRDQVMVQPFPGPGARIQVSIAGGREPVWAPDGRRLFYRDDQDLIAASVNTSGSFTVSSREKMFSDVFLRAPFHANFDVAPDGEHFLFLKATEEPQLLVVQNWVDEVRARLKAKKN
jgi:Tol biopolymer transport system component